MTITAGAETIDTEGFEGLFPNCYGFPGACWTSEDWWPSDGKEYLWDDHDFMPHTGSRSAWPAAGGAHKLDPHTDNYPPNMFSWLKYGPFDLSNAADAEINYWMAYDIEPYYDGLALFVSTDDVSWDGDYIDGNPDSNNDGIPDWVKFTRSLKPYVGNAQVWIAFAFYSDDYVPTNWLYWGPFIDDVEIKKYVAGQVTVRGSFWYNPRNAPNGPAVPARFMKVYLMDADPAGTDDQLAASATDANGNFAFPTIANWDADGTDSDIDSRGRLDLYLRWETDNMTVGRRDTV